MKRLLAVLILLALPALAHAETMAKTLYWDGDLTNTDWTSTRIYQSTTSGGPYTVKVTLGKVLSGSVSNVVTEPTTFYWIVKSVDGKGNEGVSSNEVTFLMVPDVTPPPGLTNLRFNP